MNWAGIILGLTFLVVTGIGHVIVIKGEYHFGSKIWPFFLIAGIALIIASLLVKSTLLSGILGITACTCLWSIHEVIKQKERVEKGWFPKKSVK